MSGGSMNGPPSDQTPPSGQAKAQMAKRLSRLSAVLTLVLFGLAAVVTFAWWDAQANDLAGGPRGSFSSDAMFPWFIVIPAALAGLWTASRAVALGRMSARLKRQSD
jgi:cytochrome bd-type quinol oxidase subunit 2